MIEITKKESKRNSGVEKSLERLNIGVEQAEEKISKLDDRSIEMIQSEEQKKRKD